MLKLTTLPTMPKPVNTAYSYIRFSSPEQAKGNSLERQMDKTLAYVKKNNLVLDTSLRLQDLGISGYSGDNVKKGALGLFLRAVEEGKVKSGSTLIIESFDRLGRTEVLEQHGVFLLLINAGITVVTLLDERKYSKASINHNYTDLIISIVMMSRAYEESKTKGTRVAAAWQNKRKKEGPLTSLCPAWLKLDKETKTFEILKDRAALVRRIFSMADSGKGQGIIAKTFNREKIAPWGRSQNGWHDSYIQKILTNRSVIGEYQPHTKPKGGKRLPEGEAISNYFPAIISEELFYRVNHKRNGRAAFRGPIGRNLANLFSGLAVCGYSGSSMVYVNKSQPKRESENWKYLVPAQAANGMGAKYISWRYQEFEDSFLAFVKGLDFSKVAGQRNAETEALESSLDKQKAAKDDAERNIQKLINFIEKQDSPDEAILGRIQFYRETINVSAQNIAKLEMEISTKQFNAASFQNFADLKAMALKSDLDSRFRLRDEIRSKIEKIEMFGDGAPKNSPLFEFFGSRRFYVTHFKSGKMIAIECAALPRKSSNAAKLPPRFAHYVLLDDQGRPMDALELPNGKILDISDEARAKRKKAAKS